MKALKFMTVVGVIILIAFAGAPAHAGSKPTVVPTPAEREQMELDAEIANLCVLLDTAMMWIELESAVHTLSQSADFLAEASEEDRRNLHRRYMWEIKGALMITPQDQEWTDRYDRALTQFLSAPADRFDWKGVRRLIARWERKVTIVAENAHTAFVENERRLAPDMRAARRAHIPHDCPSSQPR